VNPSQATITRLEGAYGNAYRITNAVRPSSPLHLLGDRFRACRSDARLLNASGTTSGGDPYPAGLVLPAMACFESRVERQVDVLLRIAGAEGGARRTLQVLSGQGKSLSFR